MIRRHEYDNVSVLARDLKRGKEEAFDFLFRSRYKELCRFAATFVDHFDVAEDIVQEIFERIWLKRDHILEEGTIDSYLFVSVRNACFTYLKNKREYVNLENVKQDIAFPEEKMEFDAVECRSLWMAIERLPIQCKVVFKLVVLEDMKYKEVSEKLGISVNTVKTQIKIAYKTLREDLKGKQLSFFLLFSFVRIKLFKSGVRFPRL